MNANRDFEDMRESDSHEDDLDFEDDQYENGLLRWMSIAFVACAVCGFIALAWYAYKSGMEPVNEEDIPMVEADAGNIKEKPENPGGLQFDHQDKSVYNQLAADDAAKSPPVAEQLLPPPEEPMIQPEIKDEAKPSAAEAAVTAAVEAAQSRELEAAVKDEKAVLEAKPAEKAEVVAPVGVVPAVLAEPVIAKEPVAPAAKKDESKVTVVPSSKSAEKTMAVIEPKPAKPAPKKEAAPVAAPAAKAGQYMAQLGAFRSEADANAVWSKLAATHGSALPSGAPHAVARADLGEKGVFYRLQMGPFNGDVAAKDACSALQKVNQACFVVKVK